MLCFNQLCRKGGGGGYGQKSLRLCPLLDNPGTACQVLMYIMYLCSLRFWRCCLIRVSIPDVASLHSLVRVSSRGVVRPLSSCGVSEQEKDLRQLLLVRHTAVYGDMFPSSGKQKRVCFHLANQL